MMLVVVEHSEASPTTIAVAGSVGNTDEAWNFPLYGTGIFVVPNSDPSLLPTFYVSDGNLCVVRQIIGNQSRVVAGTGECLPNGADSVPGTESTLYGPTNMYYDATTDFLYILDSSSIRLLDMKSGIISKMLITFIIPLLSNNPNNDGINGPNGIMYTPNGDLYIASQGNNKIMKYSNSQLSTVAGNGYAGYSGDGGPARNAKLNYPADVTVSSTGEVYIADWGNRAVRKVFRNGTIITLIVSGNGLSELNGVTLTPNGDLLYSTQLWVKLYMEGDSGSCIDKNTCNNHGSCVNGKCVCDSGWRGNLNCGTFSCDITPPPHSSQCIGPNQFSCQDGWTGLNCQEPVCFGTPASTTTVCSSHGQCISNNTCNCVSGWRGNSDCSAFSCDITPPPHSSQCIGPNQFSCQDGWTGLNCQEPVCFGTPANTTTVCSSHGKCISNNTCNCVSGWRGNSDCSAFSCDVKSEHGEYCIGPNTYKCQDGWIGDLCDIPLCNGIPANNPAVCNSHGQCISNNTCNCFSGWRGNSICTQFTCDGVNNCQPHGQCISNNTCKCSTGYGGNGCNDRMCFGKWGQAGCSNNGYCSNTDKCSCFPLYFGQQLSLLGKTTTTKSSSLDNQQNLESSTRILLMTESSSIIITYNNINYSITTNSSSSDAIPCYYNDANSFFFGMTFSLPKEHAQLELILGGVMIPFIILVVGCLCCLPLSMSWICMKEDIMERKQKVDFHKLDSTWDE
ncbi:predicted protein [Naegleria gruberi]|uniref:Predicted protein n=1 Tax=Naegleria gruberi TaxID=5762 RepID=D2W508_NAEGR|nr:uncharacterized protein NAEGRDRAFT_76496 [Naegleria gruberi]EFC35844.1 predicted protein [Naegleria gruberi]|eukprot:XP_002668588.1 predicted protein [Naegleria gruberi strain NEG-M]